MKKTSNPERRGRAVDQSRRSYRFDYATAKPNRFAHKLRGRTVAVVLEPDVARVFDSSESVNRVLRAVISADAPLAPAPRHRGRRAG